MAQIAYCEQEEPNSASIFSNAAWRYIDARQYEKAIEKARAALAIDPGTTDAYWSLGYALVYLGRFEEAKQIPGIEGHTILTTMMLVGSGQLEEARSRLDAYREQMDRPIDIAMLYAIVEDADEAFHWIEIGIEEGHREALLLATWELFDPLRSDPRFDAVLRRIGFTG